MGREYTRTPENADGEWMDTSEYPSAAEGQEAKVLLEGEEHEPFAVMSTVPPGGVVDPHYHYEDQWQIILEGSCTIGGETLTPGSVHYTDKMTPYGPIIAGDEGVTFLVVRNSGTRGIETTG